MFKSGKGSSDEESSERLSYKGQDEVEHEHVPYEYVRSLNMLAKP